MSRLSPVPEVFSTIPAGNRGFLQALSASATAQPPFGMPKVAAADKGHRRSGCGQWRGVIGEQHQVPLRIDHSLFGLGMSTPQKKHRSLALLGYFADQQIREKLPTPFGVASRSPFLHCQTGIQEQNTFLRPRQQTSCSDRKPLLDSCAFAHQLLEDVAKRRRYCNPLGNREGQALRLATTVVRVLTQNHNPDATQSREREGPQRFWWKNDRTFIQPSLQSGAQLLALRTPEELIFNAFPARVDRPLIGVCGTQLAGLLRVTSRLRLPCQQGELHASAEQGSERFARLRRPHEGLAHQECIHSCRTHAQHVFAGVDAAFGHQQFVRRHHGT